MSDEIETTEEEATEEIPEEETAEEEAAEEEAPPPPEDKPRFSRAFNELARAQAAFRREQAQHKESVASERAQLDQQRAGAGDLQSLGQVRELIASGQHLHAFQAMGGDFDAASRSWIEGGEPDQGALAMQQMQQKIDSLETQLSTRTQEREKEANELQRRALHRQQSETLERIDGAITALADEFPLTCSFEPQRRQKAIYSIAKQYHEAGKTLDPRQIAAILEKDAARYLQQLTTASTKKRAAAESTDANAQPDRGARRKTIGVDHSSKTRPQRSGPRTEEQREADAIEALQKAWQ